MALLALINPIPRPSGGFSPKAPIYPPKYRQLTPNRQLPNYQPPTTTQQPARYQPTSPTRQAPVRSPIVNEGPPATYRPTSPTRINIPPEAAGPAAAGASVAEGAGAGLGLGTFLPALALAIPQVLLLDSPANAPELYPPEPPQIVEPPQVPFQGGQIPNVIYRVEYMIPSRREPPDPPYIGSSTFPGPIYGFKDLPYDDPQDYTIGPGFGILCGPDKAVGRITGASTVGETKPKIINITRVDNQPDTGGDPPPTNQLIYSNPGNPVSTPQPKAPTQAPPPALPKPTLPKTPNQTPNKREPAAPLPIATPNSVPNPTITQPPLIGQPPTIPEIQFDSPPVGDTVPDFGPNTGFPMLTPTPTATPTAAPNNTNLPAPVPAPTILVQPGANPGPLVFNFKPNPETGKPEPQTIPTTTPERSPDPQRPLLDDINKVLGPIAIAIAGVTALLNPVGGKLDQISNQTNPESLKKAAKSATCETMEPGGCSYNAIENVADKATSNANNSLLEKLLAGLNAKLNLDQLALLKPIQEGVDLANTKLGPILKGADGMSGFLSRLSSSLGIDRALNLIGIASNLHNAMMLSASLKVTLLEVLSSVGNATGLLQTSENENVDLNAVFNQGIETFMTTILGTENYAGLKVGLRKYNAIYRAATNSLNATSQMFNSIGEAIETASEYTGKIGNALRAASVVRENAYNFMSERITVKTSKFMTFQTKVGDVTQVLEAINEIAENVVEGQEQYTEAVKATADFKKQLAEAEKNPGIDNKAVKAESEKIKANLVKDPTGEDETGLLSFLTDR